MISKYLNCKRSEFRDFDHIVKMCGCQYEMSSTIFDADKIWVTVMGTEEQMRRFCKKWVCIEEKKEIANNEKNFLKTFINKIIGR